MYKAISIIFGIIAITVSTIGVSQAYEELIIDYRDDSRPVHVVKVVLDGEHFVVSAVSGTGGKTLEEMTSQLPGATSSVNGAFFCPDDYSYCNGQTSTISERIFMGVAKENSTYRPDTGVRGIFGFNKNGEPFLAQNNQGYIAGLAENYNGHKLDEFYFGLGNWPVFLMEGVSVVDQYEMHLDNKLRSRRTQMFICHTQDGNTVYMGSIGATTIYEMPDLLREHFQCYNALSLDAGASTAMVYDNQVIKRSPRRRIMDAFVVINRDGYETMNYTAPERTNTTQFTPPYILNQADYDLADLIHTKIEKIISKFNNRNLRPEVRKYVIKTLYKGLAGPKATSDPRTKKVIQEIIMKYITVEKL